MKNKPSTQANTPAPAVFPNFESADRVPAVLKKLEGKTPKEVMLAMHPGIRTEVIAGFLFGLGIDLGVPIPTWAGNASNQFWKYYVRKGFDPLNSIKDTGVMAGIIEGIHKKVATSLTNELTPTWAHFAKGGSQLLFDALEKGIRALPPDEIADFYTGRAEGARVAENMWDANYLKMQKRAAIYMCVATRWKQFELFQSQAEAERWLRAQRVIGDRVSSREVSAVLTLVRLQYRGPGRPKKIKN